MENATKHLFAVSLAENKKNEYFDDTPFTAARISPATREAREKGSKEFAKAAMKSMKLPQLLIGYALIGLGLIVLLGFLKALPDTDFMTALTNGIWLLIGGAFSAAIGGALLIYCKRSQKKQDESEDLPDDMDESLNSLRPSPAASAWSWTTPMTSRSRGSRSCPTATSPPPTGTPRRC